MQYEINFVIFKNSRRFGPLNPLLVKKYLLGIALSVPFTSD